MPRTRGVYTVNEMVSGRDVKTASDLLVLFLRSMHTVRFAD